MNKFILMGTLIAMSLPLLAQASDSTDGPLTQAQIDYILKQNCDSFTGDTKNYCLQIKWKAQTQVRLGQVAPNRDGSGMSSPTTQEPKKDTPPSSQPPRDTPIFNPQPLKHDDAMNRLPRQDGMTQPPKGNPDATRPSEPSHDGTDSRDNQDHKSMLPPSRDGSGTNQPPMDRNDMGKPHRDGIGQAVEKLSPADREELMKIIRTFLESKGIQVTPPVQPTPGTHPSIEPVRPTPESIPSTEPVKLNPNMGTEPESTNTTLTNTERQNKHLTRRNIPKRKATPSTSTSASVSVNTK